MLPILFDILNPAKTSNVTRPLFFRTLCIDWIMTNFRHRGELTRAGSRAEESINAMSRRIAESFWRALAITLTRAAANLSPKVPCLLLLEVSPHARVTAAAGGAAPPEATATSPSRPPPRSPWLHLGTRCSSAARRTAQEEETSCPLQ